MGRLEVQSHLGPGDERTLADDVLDGLTRPFKELPAKHLYDARGSELFELICELPEYYPTRTERAILEARAADIVARVARLSRTEPSIETGVVENAPRITFSITVASGKIVVA